jgi:peptidoglycan/LPS O-acetylase OafA/YrhL
LFAVLAATVILAVVEGSWAGGRWLANPALRAIGLVSYGLYLWHFPVFHAVARHGEGLSEPVRVVVGLAISAAATAASWHLLERPLQGLRVRFGRRGPQPPAVPGPAPAGGQPRGSGMSPT